MYCNKGDENVHNTELISKIINTTSFITSFSFKLLIDRKYLSH
jgi:hypothetical protein